MPVSNQSDKLLQLGHAEIAIGNLQEAERYFKLVIEAEDLSAAWIGLGNTRLEFLAMHYFENPGNNSKIISNAFYCFREAKKLPEESKLKIESSIIDLSLQYLTRFYKASNKQIDEWKEKDKMQNGLLMAALLANDAGRANLREPVMQNNQQKNEILSAFNAARGVISELSTATIQFIEFSVVEKTRFIGTVESMEKELNEHLASIKDQESQSKQGGNNAGCMISIFALVMLTVLTVFLI